MRDLPVRARARRRDAAADATARTPARSRRSARASPTARSRSRRPPTWAAAPAHRRAAAASSSAPRPPRRSSAEALGLSLPHCGAGAVGPADLARHGAPLGARAGRDCERARPRHARHPDRRGDPQRDGRPRGLRRLDEPAAAHSRRSPTRPGCGARPSTTGSRVNRRVPRLVDVLPNGPRDHPTVRVFLAGGVPEVMLHLRALGLLDLDVLTVAGRARWARCSTGGRAPSGARALRERLRERDGVDPDDVIMSPEQRTRARADQHGDVPARQPRARRLGHQEHGDRSLGRRRRRRLSQDRPGARLHARARRHRRDQGPGPDRVEAGRRARADLPRAAGRGHGGDLPDHRRRSSTCRGASTWRWSPTRASPASPPAPASATSAPRRWPAGRSASSRRRP